MFGTELSRFGEGGWARFSSAGPALGFWTADRSGTGGGLVIVGWVGRFVKARRGDIGFVCSLMGGPAMVVEGEMDGVGDRGQSLKEDAKSRDVFGISTVGDNKDNLAKCVDGEEMDVGDVEIDVFFAFFDLRRGGLGGGGILAESDKR